MAAARASPHVVALGRHGGTEVAGHGASPGTHLLFGLLERSLKGRHRALPVPSYYYGMDARQSIALALEILEQADACIFALPPYPTDLDAFFLVRDKLGKRVPFIYLPLGEFPRGAWTYRHIHQRLGPDDLLLFSSTADMAVYRSLVAAAPSRSAVIPFGIDLAPYRAARKERERVRRHLGVDSGEVLFVAHGRLVAEKNPQGALLLFRDLLACHPKSRLWIVGSLPGEQGRGPGPRRADQLRGDGIVRPFKGLLDQGSLAEKVWFWGAVSPETLPLVLSAADVSVNLTVYDDENFGFSTVEAMAAGLPVVGTCWGGLKDTIDDGVTGISVATAVTARGVGYDRGQALAAAAGLAGDPLLRRTMGEAAARRSLQYSVARFGRDLDGAICAVMDRDSRGASSRHCWTPFGEELAAAYSCAPAAGLVAQPIAPTADRHRRHPILRRLMAPYASPAAPHSSDLVFPAELWDGGPPCGA